ncbi:MAG: alpha/beta fold hydrolase [Paracoccus sp. (in: a-proteobacteria)]|nr:alpha/beta fold hydrolase [Paracoccus sp. (in: a-proteobacteria)]
MILNSISAGTDNDLPPVLFVHGLFGSARNLGVLARRIEGTRRVISVDMRNHGGSFHDPDHSYAALADDLARVIEAAGGQADVVGHSMGGKASMVLALRRPELIRRLAVLDIAPVAYDHNQQGYIDAMTGMDLSGLRLRSDADRRLAASIGDAGVRAFLLQSLDLKSDPPRWKLNLPVLADQMPELVGWPAGLTPGAFAGPALFLAGEASDYVAGPGRAQAVRDYFPQAELRHMPGCGHWLHAEEPRAVAEALAQFLG